MTVQAGTVASGRYREFQRGILRIATSLETRPGAQRLTVVLNGYCDRGKDVPPVFVPWPPSGDAFGHILRVSDPTLLLADWLRGSCFLGIEGADPIPAIVEICNEIAGELGLSARQIIYFGHSGAGFGALQCAILDDAAAALGVNPVAEIGAYAAYQFAVRSAQLFRPGSVITDLLKEYPPRFSVTAALKPALSTGKTPRIGMIQNVTDKSHFRPHYGAVCESLGLPPAGGSDPSGRYHSVTYEKRGGHSALPELSVVEAMADRLLAAGHAATSR